MSTPACVVLLLLTLPAGAASEGGPAGGEAIVFVSANGTRYHRADCRRLRFGRELTVGEAARQYTPCPVCGPPRADEPDAQPEGVRPAPEAPAPRVSVPPSPPAATPERPEPGAEVARPALRPPPGGTGSWEAVAALRAGERIRITLADGLVAEGSVESASAGKLAIRTGAGARSWERAQIAKVHRLQTRSRGRTALYGALIGVGAFVVTHAISYPEEPAPVHPADAGGFLASAGAGAGIGFAVAGRTKAELIYEKGE